MSVGSYLRSARQRRRLSLDEIARATKIKPELLQDLETDDVSRWPKQRIYRHGHLRSYALAVGLDPATVLAMFDAQFGDPHPAPFHGRPRKPAGAPLSFGSVGDVVLLASVTILIGAVVRVSYHSDAASVPQPVTIRAGNGNIDEPRPAAESAFPPATESTMQGSAGVLTTQNSDVQAEMSTAAEVEDADVEGELFITSRPSRAHVTVNGIGRGTTPLRVRYLPPGAYTVRLIRDGYRIRETRVTLSAEQPSRVVRVVLRDAPTFASAALGRFESSRLSE
jgi:cytoskeletal protein RodZ